MLCCSSGLGAWKCGMGKGYGMAQQPLGGLTDASQSGYGGYTVEHG